jgi:hypothetical protein
MGNGDDWEDPKYRKGWRNGKRAEVKRRPLWILVGFGLSYLLLFIIWVLSRI